MLKNQLTGEEISAEDIKSLADLAKVQLELESLIAFQESILQDRKEQLKQLSESIIPEAMMAIGMEEFTLASGEKVSVKKYYSASIPGDRLSEALDWLRKTGNDDIVKNQIALQFGKGEDDLANLVAEELRKKGLHPEQKTFVHPMTLKSFVKERIENAQELPQELFGVFVGNKTKITPAK